MSHHQSGSLPGVKYVSLWEHSGYGVAARRYILGLQRAGVPVTWAPMVLRRSGYEPFLDRQVGDPELDPLCNRTIPYDRVIVHTTPEYFPLWRQREPDATMLGYTVWETDKIPAHWRTLLNVPDALLVPCDWNLMRQGGIKRPIEVIPHSLDLDHAAHLMQLVVTSQAEAVARGEALKQHVWTHFYEEVVTAQLIDALTRSAT